jgi:diadenosine tetraphosphate (Ap4A) HIT family hydrolase
MFRLHERLDADTAAVGRLDLCLVRLMDNRHWPWVILVPARPEMVEIHQLDAAGRALLIEEIARVSAALEGLFRPDKINVGALGNVVSQLHVHVIARRAGDPAWPGPVWGSGHAEPYAPADRDRLVLRLRDALGMTGT